MVERLTYGNIPVKGHGNEQYHLHPTNDVDEEEDQVIYQATKGDDFRFLKRSYIILGEVTEETPMSARRGWPTEKVHGRV